MNFSCKCCQGNESLPVCQWNNFFALHNKNAKLPTSCCQWPLQCLSWFSFRWSCEWFLDELRWLVSWKLACSKRGSSAKSLWALTVSSTWCNSLDEQIERDRFLWSQYVFFFLFEKLWIKAAWTVLRRVYLHFKLYSYRFLLVDQSGQSHETSTAISKYYLENATKGFRQMKNLSFISH